MSQTRQFKNRAVFEAGSRDFGGGTLFPFSCPPHPESRKRTLPQKGSRHPDCLEALPRLRTGWTCDPGPEIWPLLAGGVTLRSAPHFWRVPTGEKDHPAGGTLKGSCSSPPPPLTAPCLRSLPRVKLEAAHEGRKPRDAGVQDRPREAAGNLPRYSLCLQDYNTPPPPQVTTKACHI